LLFYINRTEVFKFGCTKLNVPFQTLLKLTDDITISPSGVAFVKKNICKGILPSMLQEILDTRIMVNNDDTNVLVIFVYLLTFTKLFI